jgi:hypothetical protein
MTSHGGNRSKKKKPVGRPKKQDPQKPKTRSMDRADRQRAKKSRNKMSRKQVEWVLSQKGTGKGCRAISKEYKKKYHGIHRISHQMVWKIWKGLAHNPDAVVARQETEEDADTEHEISIYDLIDNAKSLSEDDLDDLLEDITDKKVRY